jgi:hypothetical protein
LEDNATALIAATVGVVSALGAGIRTLFVLLVTTPREENKELKVELKAMTKELYKAQRELDWYLVKYGGKRANSSSPPPISR